MMAPRSPHDEPETPQAGDEPVPWAADEDNEDLYRLADIEDDEEEALATTSPPSPEEERVPWFEEDDGQDYEVEPVDAEVLAAERQRAAEKIAQVQRRAALQDLYDQRHEGIHGGDPDKLLKSFRFRFQIKDIMILTAVVAIVLTLVKLTSPGLALLLLILVGAGGPLAYFEWLEFRRRQAFERKRRRLLAEMRRDSAAKKDLERAAEAAAGGAPPVSARPIRAGRDPERLDETEWLTEPKQRFRFRFSLKQLIGAVTVAAVVLTLARLTGGPVQMATLLGMVALIGLVLHIAGFEVPEVVAFGWWVLLLLYIVMSILAFFVPSF